MNIELEYLLIICMLSLYSYNYVQNEKINYSKIVSFYTNIYNKDRSIWDELDLQSKFDLLHSAIHFYFLFLLLA